MESIVSDDVCQLTNRDSLQDLIVVLDAHNQKSYHLGFGKSVTRSNLSKANEKRDSKIFEDYALYLIDIARKKRSNNHFEIKGKVYAFDSSTIDLCLNVFWWAKFRKVKAGIKIHTLFYITTQIPAFTHITGSPAKVVESMFTVKFIPSRKLPKRTIKILSWQSLPWQKTIESFFLVLSSYLYP